MRNLKTKGFTLVELIVVIAIIGVLAAVLVPAMLGYMRDSKISQANQNAHAVYTAAQAAVTKYATANGTKDLKNLAFQDEAEEKGSFMGEDLVNGDVTLVDFGDYLGDQFIGSFGFRTGASGDTVEFAVWTQDATDLEVPTDEETQIKMYKAEEGYTGVVGVHPQYPAEGATLESGE